jgi:hypothetical protein
LRASLGGAVRTDNLKGSTVKSKFILGLISLIASAPAFAGIIVSESLRPWYSAFARMFGA